jgi:hypothetical protein
VPSSIGFITLLSSLPSWYNYHGVQNVANVNRSFDLGSMTLCQLAASLDNSEGPENPVQKLNSQEDRFVKQKKNRDRSFLSYVDETHICTCIKGW